MFRCLFCRKFNLKKLLLSRKTYRYPLLYSKGARQVIQQPQYFPEWYLKGLSTTDQMRRHMFQDSQQFDSSDHFFVSSSSLSPHLHLCVIPLKIQEYLHLNFFFLISSFNISIDFLKQFIRLRLFFYFTPLYFIFYSNLIFTLLIVIYFIWDTFFFFFFLYDFLLIFKMTWVFLGFFNYCSLLDLLWLINI